MVSIISYQHNLLNKQIYLYIDASGDYVNEVCIRHIHVWNIGLYCFSCFVAIKREWLNVKTQLYINLCIIYKVYFMEKKVQCKNTHTLFENAAPLF